MLTESKTYKPNNKTSPYQFNRAVPMRKCIYCFENCDKVVEGVKKVFKVSGVDKKIEVLPEMLENAYAVTVV